MAISEGERLPEATLVRMGDSGPEEVTLSSLTKGRKVVIFGLPGAFTSTCSTAHMPSMIRTKDQMMAKGVDDVICISVNDPFVMDAWARDTGADKAGIKLLADLDSSFTKSIGMEFSVPALGFFDRSKRYTMLVEDGKVTIFNEELGRGVCETSSGETLLAAM